MVKNIANAFILQQMSMAANPLQQLQQQYQQLQQYQQQAYHHFIYVFCGYVLFKRIFSV